MFAVAGKCYGSAEKGHEAFSSLFPVIGSENTVSLASSQIDANGTIFYAVQITNAQGTNYQGRSLTLSRCDMPDEFSTATAAMIFSFSFSFVLGVFLVAKGVGQVMSVVK